MRAKTLVPDPRVITIERIVPDAADILLVARTRRCTVPCPVCEQPATRVHSWYIRSLRDLPWQGLAVRMELHTRRWFCDNPCCPRRIFTEVCETSGSALRVRPLAVQQSAHHSSKARRVLLRYGQRALRRRDRWGIIATGAMSIGHKGMLDAASVLALAAADLFAPPHLAEARVPLPSAFGDGALPALGRLSDDWGSALLPRYRRRKCVPRLFHRLKPCVRGIDRRPHRVNRGARGALVVR